MVTVSNSLSRCRRARFVQRVRTVAVVRALEAQTATLGVYVHPDRNGGVVEFAIERAIRTDGGLLFRVEGSRYPAGNPDHIAALSKDLVA